MRFIIKLERVRFPHRGIQIRLVAGLEIATYQRLHQTNKLLVLLQTCK